MASATDVVCSKPLNWMFIKANKQKNKSRCCLLVWPYRHEGVMKEAIHQKDTEVCLEVMAYFQKEQGSVLLSGRVWVGGRSLGGQALLMCEQRLVSTSSPLHSNNLFFLFSFESASTQKQTHSLRYNLSFFWTYFPFERIIFKMSENLQTSNATWKRRYLKKGREKTFEFMSIWQLNKSCHWILYQA